MMQERTNGMMWMPFVNKVPKQTCTVKPNINKQEVKAVRQNQSSRVRNQTSSSTRVRNPNSSSTVRNGTVIATVTLDGPVIATVTID
jgi:hypothetical protein